MSLDLSVVFLYFHEYTLIKFAPWFCGVSRMTSCSTKSGFALVIAALSMFCLFVMTMFSTCDASMSLFCALSAPISSAGVSISQYCGEILI